MTTYDVSRVQAQNVTYDIVHACVLAVRAPRRKLASRNAVEMTPATPISKMFVATMTTTARWFIGAAVVRPTNSISGSLWRHVLFIDSAPTSKIHATISIAIRRCCRRTCNYGASRHNNTPFNDDLVLFYVPMQLILHRSDDLLRFISCISYNKRTSLSRVYEISTVLSTVCPKRNDYLYWTLKTTAIITDIVWSFNTVHWARVPRWGFKLLDVSFHVI